MCNVPFATSLVVLLFSVVIYYIFMTNSKQTEPMAKNGLLFLSSVAKTNNIYSKASMYTKNMLYVKIKGKPEAMFPLASKQIVDLYSQATSKCINLDVRLILKPTDAIKNVKTNHPIDIMLYDSELSEEIDNLQRSILTLNTGSKLKCIEIEAADLRELSEEDVKTYEYVALGGTFDRLHNGHKILLSQAALRSTRHVTVGVTDVNMIQSKKLWELIQPVEDRIKAVKDFLTDINPDLEYNIVPIRDLYGPTKDDPRYQLIVVSEETVRGSTKINEKRLENGLQKLETYVVKLAHDSHPQRSQEEEDKVSSSNIRMRLLGTLLKSPKPNPNIPDWPYVIGLAGGIASGKSNIAEKLKAKGAAVINCDIIAHDLYKPGLPLNSTLSTIFGKDIITETGEVDRRKLGSIVFGDKEQLEKLNSIVWPAVIEEAQRRIRALGEAGYKVVVMEAAVMVRAKWYNYCHQLWSVIIPPEEAITRLQKRNNLSEEEAKQRIASQPSNQEQVELANIVFSPYWSYEYTQSQIDRAWDHLQEYLRDRISTDSERLGKPESKY